MSQSKRLSQSWKDATSTTHIAVLDADAEEWTNHWKTVLARDLIDSRLVSIDAETSVEDACELLLSENISCLAVKSPSQEATQYLGLFDYSDVNAFLTLAATSHTLSQDDLRFNPRVESIVSAAKAGRVPVQLVSDLSEKNPLQAIPNDATIISLLQSFSRGIHRVLIQAPAPSDDFIGTVSDRSLLSWFSSHAKDTISLSQYLANPLLSLTLPSVNMHTSVVAATSTSSVLDAMKLMSEEGVSSVAVLDEDSGFLLSAVSVTDIGQVVVPFQSNQILSTPLHAFISRVKASYGSDDGADRYPVYSLSPTSALSYAIEKLLATNAHRLFVTRDSGPASPALAPIFSGNLAGILSIVDILSLFAHIAKIPNIDPTHMQRHRRASSASSQSSKSDRDLFNKSRSSSRASVRRSPSIIASPNLIASNPPTITESTRNSLTSLDVIQRRESLRALKRES